MRDTLFFTLGDRDDPIAFRTVGGRHFATNARGAIVRQARDLVILARAARHRPEPGQWWECDLQRAARCWLAFPLRHVADPRLAVARQAIIAAQRTGVEDRHRPERVLFGDWSKATVGYNAIIVPVIGATPRTDEPTLVGELSMNNLRIDDFDGVLGAALGIGVAQEPWL